VEERRRGRIGTVNALALLVGGTAVTAAAEGARSVFATLLLGMLTVGMAHALLDEIRRQARRRPAPGWAVHDTVNTALLVTWVAGALGAAALPLVPAAVRVIGLALAVGYALSCGYFVIERRRTIAAMVPIEPVDR
jgi:hypothetical protein